MLLAGVLTGTAPFKQLGGDAPIADAFKDLGKDWVAAIVYVGALAATLKTVMFLMLGQSRVAFAMCRDNLLPERFGRTHERYGTPHKITLITMVVVAAMAGFVPLSTLAELVNIGTLFAFMLVAAGVLYLRSADPERERPFRTPGAPVVPCWRSPAASTSRSRCRPRRGSASALDGARADRLRALRARRERGEREPLTQVGGGVGAALDDVAVRVGDVLRAPAARDVLLEGVARGVEAEGEQLDGEVVLGQWQSTLSPLTSMFVRGRGRPCRWRRARKPPRDR